MRIHEASFPHLGRRAFPYPRLGQSECRLWRARHASRRQGPCCVVNITVLSPGPVWNKRGDESYHRLGLGGRPAFTTCPRDDHVGHSGICIQGLVNVVYDKTRDDGDDGQDAGYAMRQVL